MSTGDQNIKTAAQFHHNDATGQINHQVGHESPFQGKNHPLSQGEFALRSTQRALDKTFVQTLDSHAKLAKSGDVHKGADGVLYHNDGGGSSGGEAQVAKAAPPPAGEHNQPKSIDLAQNDPLKKAQEANSKLPGSEYATATPEQVAEIKRKADAAMGWGSAA